MILYQKLQEGGTTSSYYNVGDDNRINAGPYLGLTLEEAKDLNQGQWEDYNKGIKTADRAEFMRGYNKGMDETFDEWMIPAMKAATSITPLGPAVGLYDAYNAWQAGDRGWAIAGAGLEALPYGGKYLSKLPWRYVGRAGKQVVDKGTDIFRKMYDPKDLYVIPKKTLKEYTSSAAHYGKYTKGDPDVVASAFTDKIPMTHVTKNKGIFKRASTSVDTDYIGGPKNYLDTGFKDPPRPRKPRREYMDPLAAAKDMYRTSDIESSILVDYAINRGGNPRHLPSITPEIYNVLDQIKIPEINKLFRTFKQQAGNVRKLRGLTSGQLQRAGIPSSRLQALYPKAEEAIELNAEKLLNYIEKFKEVDLRKLK